MEVQDLIPLAYFEATGTAYTGSGDSTDPNWVRMLGYANLWQRQWAREAGGNWESLYDPGISAGSITATDTYSLPTGMRMPSNKAKDYIWILWADGVSITRYKTVPGPQLKDYIYDNHAVAFVRGQLRFPRAFKDTDNEYGGTLYVPGFMTVSTLVNPTDLVAVDDPDWLAFMSAQEWAQPDVTLVQNVPSLISKATESMTSMKLDNQRIRKMSQETPAHGAGAGDTWSGGLL